jgi:hypothetical protein
MNKKTAAIVLILLVASMIPMSFGSPQERVSLGRIALPRDAEFPAEDENGPMTASLPKGEYRLFLMILDEGKKLGIGLISLDSGTAFGCPTEVADSTENYAEPKSEVTVVTKDGQDFVQIVVFTGNKKAVSLMKCST